MPSLVVYVPVGDVFPKLTADFASFCATVRSLSRTDTLFWCARLNLILSNPQNRNEKGKQEYAVYHFLDADEVAHLNRFMKDHPQARVFFREQLLELIRWTCLLGEDQPGDGGTFADPETRRRFAQAAMMASDVWANRVYKDGLPTTGDHAEDLRQAMVAFRRGVMTRAPDLMCVLARGDAIYREFQGVYADAEKDFHSATNMTMAVYMACLWALTIQFANIDPATASENSGGFRINVVRTGLPVEMREPFDLYIQRESQTADALRESLLRQANGAEPHESDTFDEEPLRDRSLLRTADGRAIVLDPSFYGDKASVGPLFVIVKALGKSGKVNTVFGAFGVAFERYVNGLLKSMYPSHPPLVETLACNPRGRKGRDDVEIADACLNEVTEVVLFESKGVFLREDATHDTDAYEQELRKKYSESKGTGTDRKTKGVAQLGRSIKDIALGQLVPLGGGWERVECVYPVLVSYDVRVATPGHTAFFEKEFRAAVEPDLVLAGGYMRKGRLTVAPLVVMTIDDLEHLQSSVEHFRLIDFLRDYANSAQDGARASLHDFMVAVDGKKYRFVPSKDLADRAMRAIEETHRRVFPHLPLPGTATSKPGDYLDGDLQQRRKGSID